MDADTDACARRSVDRPACVHSSKSNNQSQSDNAAYSKARQPMNGGHALCRRTFNGYAK